MPDWVFTVGYQVGGTGAVLLLAALWTLRAGWWAPADTVRRLDAEIGRLRGELTAEREKHGSELDIWEQRTFNALGVADRLSRLSEDQMMRTSGDRPLGGRRI